MSSFSLRKNSSRSSFSREMAGVAGLESSTKAGLKEDGVGVLGDGDVAADDDVAAPGFDDLSMEAH